MSDTIKCRVCGEEKEIVALASMAWLLSDYICAACSRLERTAYQDEDEDEDGTTSSAVEHPAHYTSHLSGVECIQITEHMGFCLGNAVKYLWRADEKGKALEDLKKARWYIDREIERRARPQRMVLLRETDKRDPEG